MLSGLYKEVELQKNIKKYEESKQIIQNINIIYNVLCSNNIREKEIYSELYKSLLQLKNRVLCNNCLNINAKHTNNRLYQEVSRD